MKLVGPTVQHNVFWSKLDAGNFVGEKKSVKSTLFGDFYVTFPKGKIISTYIKAFFSHVFIGQTKSFIKLGKERSGSKIRSKSAAASKAHRRDDIMPRISSVILRQNLA